MKIDCISSDGIHASEKDALERMRQAFNASEFSQKWHGYAGFMMMDTTYRDREIDLVLLTHDRLLIVELKKWRGKIEPMQDHWLRSGEDMGRSPVKVLADKWKILSSKIQARLSNPAKSVYIDYRVVMCGSADFSAIPEDEKAFVLTLDQFLRIAKSGGYRQEFKDSRSGTPNQYVQTFTSFFRGKDFKPSGFSFNNFQIVGEASFPHPDGLYKEYKSVKKDDHRHEALLRRWDFSALTGVADTVDERARIALREHKVLGFIHEQNEQLDGVVLQPLSHPTRDDIDADFCELYRLPSRQLRLNEFVHRHGHDLSFVERISLVKVLLSHFADLHDTGVAHRDVSDHSLWFERPSKVSISGFLTAYFPEAGTVGPLRDNLRAGKALLPEDSEIGRGEVSDPFRRDVYLLGVAAYHLLFLRLPRLDDGIFLWEPTEVSECDSNVSAWFEQALEMIPSERFANARAMLDALNSLSLESQSARGVDLRVFEAYRSDLIPMVVYPLLENLKQGHSHLYKSSVGGRSVSVKVWYGRQPDPKRPEDTQQLQAFLEKARLLKTQPCSSLPEVIDFGISDAGTFLVQQWVDGQALDTATDSFSSGQQVLDLCHQLVKATLHLHSLGLQHGDIHPGNIMLEGSALHFIDTIDMVSGSLTETHTPAYVPADYESIALDQRDCYAVAKMCGELLDRWPAWEDHDVGPVRLEIQRCLSRELRVYALDRIDDALDLLLNPPCPNSGPQLAVQLRRLTASKPFQSDNGVYHIGVLAQSVRDPKSQPSVVISVAGVRARLQIMLKPTTLDFVNIRNQEMPHSQFVHTASQAVATLKADILFAPASADNVIELLKALQAIPDIKAAIELVRAQILGLDYLTATDDLYDEKGEELTSEGLRTEDLWRSILEAEEATLPEVEVAGAVDRDIGRHRDKVRIPYTKEGEPLDYGPDNKVEALQEIHGELVRVGHVDIRETTQAILVLDNTRIRMQLNEGDRIKLRSQQDLSSFRRRRQAVTRILAREAVLPNLIDYFDPANCPAPLELQPPPTDAELNAYNRYDDEGQLIFSLNLQQREAFAKLWAQGPLSLLQGPPGTGKTSFIASFIHYAMSHGAQSILLTSQSHEAVNNAAEKVIELCQRTEMPLDVVRFGAEGMVSEQLLPHHSASILQAYRDLFRAEMRERVTALNRNLGLPNPFVTVWFDIEFHLGRLMREIDRLESKRAQTDPYGDAYKSLTQRISQRRERFRTLAEEKFFYTSFAEPPEVIDYLRSTAMAAHAVTSLDAVSRLDQVIAISQEWVDRLGTLRGNFEEFLAKTRTLVCGTCVGMGRSQFGVANIKYDWVVVDEAARATPGELAIAIQSARRVLLVGDHRQLPPHYTKQVVQRIAADLQWRDRSMLTRSDFERAFESSYGRQVGATLRTQYRMAPPIGELVSACFYPIPLAPGRGAPIAWFDQLPEPLRAVVTWIDTSEAGRESYDRPKNPGFDNSYEAREIIDLLRSICTSGNFIQELMQDSSEDEKPIGVICMYAEQKKLLQRLLSEQDWATGYRRLIKIDTVDSYQGKENRIIIVSTTRNNRLYDQGFLSSVERVNVAISRAMDRLFIIGAARMWRERNQEAPLGRVLAYIEQHRDGSAFAVVETSGITGGRS
ncbi:AAA domain-containing protein [Pseudomonas sp. ACN5]|uniref:AAA domain-containing protein n=1 Tax=Pseudomonas sp. ACN5 TaxID=1920427 RepID=UPI000BB396E0|nr:AAA domain-containing protein [Pseudomonas sp. ACN5]PBJ10758.1 ATP-dependent RecD-like DNA helicase [Pseudomonas sp. ACN5]